MFCDTDGAPGRGRTCNPRIRSPMLYPLSYRRLELFISAIILSLILPLILEKSVPCVAVVSFLFG